jgi:bacterioferritin
MPKAFSNKKKAVKILNKILEMELAGVVRYTHYSFMVYGFNRIPIVKWLQEQASDSLDHAYKAGEMITALGEHPSLGIGPLLETEKHAIEDILKESFDTEQEALKLYKGLLALVKGKSVLLEEYARKMIEAEELHADEVDKMLRKPGELASYQK